MLRGFLFEGAIAVLASQNMFSMVVKHVVDLLPSGTQTKRSSRRTLSLALIRCLAAK